MFQMMKLYNIRDNCNILLYVFMRVYSLPTFCLYQSMSNEHIAVETECFDNSPNALLWRRKSENKCHRHYVTSMTKPLFTFRNILG